MIGFGFRYVVHSLSYLCQARLSHRLQQQIHVFNHFFWQENEHIAYSVAQLAGRVHCLCRLLSPPIDAILVPSQRHQDLRYDLLCLRVLARVRFHLHLARKLASISSSSRPESQPSASHLIRSFLPCNCPRASAAPFAGTSSSSRPAPLSHLQLQRTV